jgi:predicted DNA-binding transcriptional regulator AlpA
MIMTELIDTEELARRTGMSVSYWNKRRLVGDGPAFKRIGRCARYAWSDVEAWLTTKQFSSTSEEGPSNG